MGDRANIVIRDAFSHYSHSREAVSLYGHWSGEELPGVLHKALSLHERWDDGAYLARIVFQAMLDGDTGTTGFGISTRLPDNERDLLVLDIGQQRVVRLPERSYTADGFDALNTFAAISFTDYVAAPERTWDNLTTVAVER